MGQELSRTVSGGQMESSAVNAVGVWFYSIDTQRYLYLMRNDPKHPGAFTNTDKSGLTVIPKDFRLEYSN